MKTANRRPVLLRLLYIILAALVAVPVFADEGDPPARVARISYMHGNVSFQPSGESQWSQASLNYPVTTNDRLFTDQGARAEVEAGPYSVHLSESTDLTMADLNDQIMQLGLGQGIIRVSIFALPNGNTVEVDTPNGALTLLSPGSYRMETYPNDGSTFVIVNRGSLQVTGGGANQMVEAGQAVKLTGTGPIQVQFVSPPREDAFDDWCASRDRRVSSYNHSQYFSGDVPGSEDLDAYGNWQSAPGYGPVWYPGGVPVGWMPYRYGRWAWVSPWGWTWVGDEPWGWAPFHYGRWAFFGARWGWIPGPEMMMPMYAPALVAFVGGAGFGIGVSLGGPVGWFPLGPRDPFFPWYHCGPTYLRQVNITNIRNVTNITNIVNVRNINNVHYAYERTAVTAVSAAAFRSGQPVARQMVRMTPQQIARAQVIPHPFVNPTTAATLPGRQVGAPPVRAAHYTRATPPARAEAVPRSAPPPSSRPAVQRNASRPPLITRSAPPSGSRVATPSNSTPRFITRTQPPPRALPFTVRRQAMQEHPGRPLEPQQRANLRAGRPAGPIRDREFPPHPQRQDKSSPRSQGGHPNQRG